MPLGNLISSKRNIWKTIQFKCIYLFKPSPVPTKIRDRNWKYDIVHMLQLRWGHRLTKGEDGLFSLRSQGGLRSGAAGAGHGGSSLAHLVTQQEAQVSGVGQTTIHPSKVCALS